VSSSDVLAGGLNDLNLLLPLNGLAAIRNGHHGAVTHDDASPDPALLNFLARFNHPSSSDEDD